MRPSAIAAAPPPHLLAGNGIGVQACSRPVARFSVRTEDWFREQLGRPIPFAGPADWLGASDPRLLWVTNGEVWHDPLGHVTRSRLQLAYYPPEVWLKKLATKCMLVQILGPYQTRRAIQRGDEVLPFLTRGQFVREALHLVFLLNRRYAPFGKWLLPLFNRLPDMHGLEPAAVGAVLREPDLGRLLGRVDEMAGRLHQAASAHFAEVGESTNLLELGFRLSERIEDPAIRELPFWDQELVF